MRDLQMKSFYGFVIKRDIGSGAIYKSVYWGMCRIPDDVYQLDIL